MGTHIKCNKINKQTYNILQNDNTMWYCINCSKSLFPFSDSVDQELLHTIQGKMIKFVGITKKHTNNENVLIERLNEALNCSELAHTSAYFEASDINTSFNSKEFNKLNFFRLNISSLSYNFNQLHELLSTLKIDFNFIAITESKIQKNITPINNVDLDGYVIEHTPTESSCGGALLYIKDSIKYKVRHDLAMYKKKELESIFIEVINPQGKNIIVGCVYRHPCMDLSLFNDTYLRDLLDKLICENKTIIIMGEFSKRCEFEPAWDPHRRRFFRGCLIERSEFRSSNGSFKYNQDLDRRALIDNSAISTEEAILGKYK